MTWKKIMGYAHQGIELKPIPGVAPPPDPIGPQLPVAETRPGDEIPRPTLLTKRGTDILVRIERAMEDASRALAKKQGPVQGRGPSASHGPSVQVATDGESSESVRGN
jgi:penicillin-binding protein 1A